MILTKTPCSCNEERAHTNTLHINRGKVSLIQLDPPDQIQLHRAAQMSRISMRQIRKTLQHRKNIMEKKCTVPQHCRQCEPPKYNCCQCESPKHNLSHHSYESLILSICRTFSCSCFILYSICYLSITYI